MSEPAPSEVFLPVPRTVATTNSRFEVPVPVRFRVEALDDRRLERRLVETLAGSGIRAIPTDGAADLILGKRGGPPQSYRLRVDDHRISIEAPDAAGLYYGSLTLQQWMDAQPSFAEGSKRFLPGLAVDDSPDFETRGVMLDVSRNKVPTIATLEALIDQLARWKINHLQLYMEHTFAYTGHETVWRGWSPLTAAEIRHLDRYCRDRFVELAPNQNSFGHLHRWLVHKKYQPLAECPDGLRHPFSDRAEPFSLCPTDPASLALLEDLYDQLLPCFSSRRFNVGLDETFDLGRGRSAEECSKKGRGRVYLEFLAQVHRLVRDRDRQMLFWGDIVLEHPDLVPELPRDATALVWGYESHHDFEAASRRFAEAGLDFWLCPGTSSWLSLAGRSDNALGNLANACRAGVAQGASGLLVTDWGDHGHLQPLPVSALGFAAGASGAWSSQSLDPALPSMDPPVNWPAILDRHAFADHASILGRAFFDLGNVYQFASASSINASILFRLLLETGGTLAHSRFDGLTIESLQTCSEEVARVARRLDRARSTRTDAELLVAEARWVAAGLELLCALGRGRLEAGRNQPISALASADRKALTESCLELEQRARPLWLARNRPGGLEPSMAVFSNLAAALR